MTISRYRQSQIEGAGPQQLVVLLLERAVSRAKLAQRLCTPSQDAPRADAVRNLLDIVIELRSTLDHSVAEVAQNLDALYDYIITETIEANAERDPERLQPVVSVLDTLREAFTQAAATVTDDELAQARTQSRQLSATKVAATPAPANDATVSTVASETLSVSATPAPTTPAATMKSGRTGQAVLRYVSLSSAA